MISHPFISFGQQVTAGQQPGSSVQGAFVRRYGMVRGAIVDPVRTYKETVVEPQQTDKESKQ